MPAGAGSSICLRISPARDTAARCRDLQRQTPAACPVHTSRARVERGRVHARIQVFLVLCLRLVVAITNFERGDDPSSEKLKL